MTPSSPTMSSRPTSVEMFAIQRRASASSRIVDRRRHHRSDGRRSAEGQARSGHAGRRRHGRHGFLSVPHVTREEGAAPGPPLFALGRELNLRVVWQLSETVDRYPRGHGTFLCSAVRLTSRENRHGRLLHLRPQAGSPGALMIDGAASPNADGRDSIGCEEKAEAAHKHGAQVPLRREAHRPANSRRRAPLPITKQRCLNPASRSRIEVLQALYALTFCRCSTGWPAATAWAGALDNAVSSLLTIGAPRPVTRSYPGAAVKPPLLPETMSLKDELPSNG